LVVWALDKAADQHQRRRQAAVLVHEAVFLSRDPATGSKTGGSAPQYFVKVTNLSEARDIEITHVWVDGKPQVHLMNPARPLPARLRQDETWENRPTPSSQPRDRPPAR
jgi:hypothetical protein